MSTGEPKRVSIVVPVYHNAGSLNDLLNRFQALANRHPESFEFIFVDDGSRDGSFAVLEGLVARDRRVKAIKLSRNFGANAASTAGIAHAAGDAVVAISADLQDPPELVDQMLERWRAGYRVVLAARASRQDPWITRVTSNLYWRLFRRFAVPSMPKHGCDFCLIDRKVINALAQTHEPNSGVGMVLWTGFEPSVIYYHRRERESRYGQSMWNFSKKVTYLVDSFVAFSDMPVRAASMMGITLGLMGVLYAGLVVVSKLVFGVALQEGWASTIVVILVVSGAQLLMTGILGEYLLRALELARQRPPYVIDQVLQASAESPAEAASPAAGTRESDTGATR